MGSAKHFLIKHNGAIIGLALFGTFIALSRWIMNLGYANMAAYDFYMARLQESQTLTESQYYALWAMHYQAQGNNFFILSWTLIGVGVTLGFALGSSDLSDIESQVLISLVADIRELLSQQRQAQDTRTEESTQGEDKTTKKMTQT